MKKLPLIFFQRKTLVIAKDLIGKHLVRSIDGNIIREMITETEAYIGPHDLASHSAKGRTRRTEVMYSKGGAIYVYLIYGLHNMLNIVTEGENFPSAILIRSTASTTGPGRVAKQFKIDKNLNGKMLGLKTGLWIEEGETISPKGIFKTPRVGVDYAGEIWSKKLFRFLLKK
ncbi:MAG: DNA-3-methyladenine glycosylase [bacterium]|nr:DNA-3-methyladenine glycosylase [bacterium]